MAKKRLDVLLFEKGLCPSRERAKTAIMEGIVYIAGQKAGKAGDMVDENAELEVRGNENAFVSRGGKKIEKALDYFAIDPSGLVVMDVGASTGGFTDCLLRRGAVKVYSIDVGYGQLAWSLRQDPRVKCMERTNIRYVTPDMLEETPSLCVIDVSFISLRLVLPVVSGLLSEDGRVACLIKPQFEAGKGKVGKKRRGARAGNPSGSIAAVCGKRAHSGLCGARCDVFAHQGAGREYRIFGLLMEAGRGQRARPERGCAAGT